MLKNEFFQTKQCELEGLTNHVYELSNKLKIIQTDFNIHEEELNFKISETENKLNSIRLEVINEEKITGELIQSKEIERDNLIGQIKQLEDQLTKLKQAEMDSEIELIKDEFENLKKEEREKIEHELEAVEEKITETEQEYNESNYEVNRIEENMLMLNEEYISNESFLVNLISLKETLEELLSNFQFIRSVKSKTSNILYYLNNKTNVEINKSNNTGVNLKTIELNFYELKHINLNKLSNSLFEYFSELLLNQSLLTQYDFESLIKNVFSAFPDKIEEFFEILCEMIFGLLTDSCINEETKQILEDIDQALLRNFLKILSKYLYYEYVIDKAFNFNSEYKELKKDNKQKLTQVINGINIICNRYDHYIVRRDELVDKTKTTDKKIHYEIKLKAISIIDEKLGEYIKRKTTLDDELEILKTKFNDKLKSLSIQIELLESQLSALLERKKFIINDFENNKVNINKETSKLNTRILNKLKKVKEYIISIKIKSDTSLDDLENVNHNINMFKMILERISNKQVDKIISDSENVITSFKKRILRKLDKKNKEDASNTSKISSIGHKKTQSIISNDRSYSRINNSYSSQLVKRNGSICINSDIKSELADPASNKIDSDKITTTSIINLPNNEPILNESDASPFKILNKPKIEINKKVSYNKSYEQSTILSRKKILLDSEYTSRQEEYEPIEKDKHENNKTFLIESLKANKIYNKLKYNTDTKRVAKLVSIQKIKSVEKKCNNNIASNKINNNSNKIRSQILTTADKLFTNDNYKSNKTKIIDYNEFINELKLVNIDTKPSQLDTDNNTNKKQFNSFNKYTSDINNLSFLENTYNKLKPLIEGSIVYIADKPIGLDILSTILPEGLEQYSIRYNNGDIIFTRQANTFQVSINSLSKTSLAKQLKESQNTNKLAYKYFPLRLELNDKRQIEAIFTSHIEFKKWLYGIAYLLKLV